jgi:hypothetical protein
MQSCSEELREMRIEDEKRKEILLERSYTDSKRKAEHICIEVEW